MLLEICDAAEVFFSYSDVCSKYHCRILPMIDDGAKDVETSLAMIEMMKEQGGERIVAT
ncbi:CpsB/CapC family capsule biosynthesis tyrosine phosphatase [Ruminococcus flavefaciens]|uniref:CpsB/CapC family capsule biosynthesis tyrosine phosphatase n=1 Tax=Ruminococcus flavefaciens TaxID=1265 RepID=UPI00158740AD|nr:CpsB/CapC family capsule biosynthesis tyrosine phosphatase [Ruminococcus flavefaciens]